MSAVQQTLGSVQNDDFGDLSDEQQPLVRKTETGLFKRQVKIGPCHVRAVVLIAVFSVGLVFGRVATFASSPLWIDSIKPVERLTNSTRTSNSSSSVQDANVGWAYKRHINFGSPRQSRDVLDPTSLKGTGSNFTFDRTEFISPYYIVLAQQFTCMVTFGVVLLGVVFVSPGQITDREKDYPKWQFLLIGFSMALSSILVNSAASGTKTAPYLQAILMNFSIPITFAIRFLILRKRPTLRKLLCAGIVVVTEFVCMLPTIFPNLESHEAHQAEGGGEGVGRILWPFVFVLSQVPYGIQSIIIEKVTKDQSSKSTVIRRSVMASAEQLHMVYFLFWTSAFTFLSAMFLFWTQLIPHFSDVTSFLQLGKQLWFNVDCQFGSSPCTPYVTIVSSFSIGSNLLAVFSIANLLRWSEGANFMMVISTMRTPLLFLFWTLFEESPFRWYPHASLSTWLSIGAIFVMLPAIYAYSTGSPEHESKRQKQELEITAGDN